MHWQVLFHFYQSKKVFQFWGDLSQILSGAAASLDQKDTRDS